MAINLSALQKGMNVKPPRVVIFGEEKIGKSTFAASAPEPIFMNVEDGADYINTTRAFQQGNDGGARSASEATYQDCLDLVYSLLHQPHNYGTLVIDTADALEAKIISGLLAEYNAVSLTDPKVKEFAFGGSFKMVTNKFRMLLDGLDLLREKRNMAIIIIVHSKIERINDDPVDEAHLRHVFRLSGGVEGVLKDWADCIVFARQSVYTKSEDTGFGKKITKAIDGDRMLCGAKSHAYTGGGRVDLPDKMDLSWTSFINAFNHSLHGRQNPLETRSNN